MTTIFTLGEASHDPIKINLDDLYERKQQKDLNTLALYNRVLTRIHARVKLVSRQQVKEQHCWYVMPETIIGVPNYDNGACTAYAIDQLRENGFEVKYTHPNLLLISWASHCPTYVRNEIKKKTGIVIDRMGNKIDKDDDTSDSPTTGTKANFIAPRPKIARIVAFSSYDMDRNMRPLTAAETQR